MQPVDGLGDRATVLAAGHSIMVLKGDTFFLLAFQQFVPGRDKTVALARMVAGRIQHYLADPIHSSDHNHQD